MTTRWPDTSTSPRPWAIVPATLLLAIAPPLVVAEVATAAASRPNIVLILADDMGWGDVGCNGNDAIATPALDSLFTQGVTLDRFFVSPICSPTRASLLTGRHHLRLGVLNTTSGLEVMHGDEVTLAEALNAAGYVCGCFGKWHNGSNHPSTARGQGFAAFCGFNGGFLSNSFDPSLECDGRTVAQPGFITDVLAEAAVAFIEKHASGPFFCYVPFNACHSPLQAPERLFAQYAAKGFEPKTAAEYAMVQNLDANVGRILAKLDSEGIARDTIVMFTSDNGPNRGLVRAPRYNGGMRGGKGSLFEGGLRVPCVIRWPGRLPAGARVSRIAQHVDVLPTLLELAGAAAPSTAAIDGRSLVQLLRGDETTWPDRVLFEISGRGGRDGTPIGKYPGTARSQTHRWVHDGRRTMLFDLRHDPGEQHDVAADQPQVASTLSRAYDEWFTDAIAPMAGAVRRFAVRLAGHTELLAPAATLEGGARFFGQGWDNDWATFPTEAAAIAWSVDVPRAGRYSVVALHTAAARGSHVRVTAGTASANITIAEVYAPPEIPRRDLVPRWEVPDKEFRPLQVGQLDMAAGMQSLRVTAGPGVEIQSIRLTLLDPAFQAP